MKRTLLTILVLLLQFTDAPVAWGGAGLCLATGHPGGTYFPLGEMLASMVNCDTRNFFITTRETGGAVENCLLIGDGKADAGFAMETVLCQALSGEGSFTDSGPLDLAVLAQLYPAPEHLVTVNGTGIRTLQDLKGKRVSIGMLGSGNPIFAREILDEADIDPDNDLQCLKLAQQEAA